MRFSLIGTVLSIAACPASSVYGSGVGTSRTHSATTDTSSTGTASTSGTFGTTGDTTTATGSSGSSAGTTTTTTSGGSSCQPDPASCPDSGAISLDYCGQQVELAANAYDFCNQQPVYCALAALDQLHPSLTATQVGCGYFYLCVAPDTEVNLTISAANYLALDFATVKAPASTEFQANPGVPMFCEGVYTDLFATLGQSYDPDLASMLVNVINLTGLGGSEGCLNLQGWSFELTDEDGGPVSATLVYQSGTSFDPTATSTSQGGLAFFYDIDSQATVARVTATNAAFALPDGGTLCPDIGSGYPFYLTGSVLVTPGHTSFLPHVIPAP